MKHQENLQASLKTQNMNSSGSFSPPQSYQLSELNLSDKLQEALPDRQYIHTCPSQVWNSMISYLIRVEDDSRLYAPIYSSQVTVRGGNILVKEHHYSAQ